MTIEIYKNYGCLAHEKMNVYTYGGQQGTAVCSDVLTVEIPDEVKTTENADGELLIVSPCGEWNFSVNDVLCGNEYPYFLIPTKYGEVYEKRLKIIGENI